MFFLNVNNDNHKLFVFIDSYLALAENNHLICFQRKRLTTCMKNMCLRKKSRRNLREINQSEQMHQREAKINGEERISGSLS